MYVGAIKSIEDTIKRKMVLIKRIEQRKLSHWDPTTGGRYVNTTDEYLQALRANIAGHQLNLNMLKTVASGMR